MRFQFYSVILFVIFAAPITHAQEAIFFVRHAEQMLDVEDPPLTVAGHKRAKVWAGILEKSDIKKGMALIDLDITKISLTHGKSTKDSLVELMNHFFPGEGLEKVEAALGRRQRIIFFLLRSVYAFVFLFLRIFYILR